jgi:hypothetical protein
LAGGCSGGSPAPATPQYAVLPSGAAARFDLKPSPPAHARAVPLREIERDLFVSNGGNGVLVLANKSYHEVGEITDGLDGADGVWVDKRGNVYVANYTGLNVTEYRRGRSSPSCTYSANLVDPVNVTTDDAGNVFVADGGSGSYSGYIDEYSQCSSNPTTVYTVNGSPEGVAVDRRGDIFVSYLVASNGFFEEFEKGSKSATILNARVGFAGGLVLDAKRNLIAVDQTGAIDVIAPPYDSAKVLIDGLTQPFHCSLNKREDLLFDADIRESTVTVFKYPSGKKITTLGNADGIYGAAGVGESPNATF